ncbi:hypothetical protein GEMRC1_010838 [Eukaryota sp. GEM-RC1]
MSHNEADLTAPLLPQMSFPLAPITTAPILTIPFKSTMLPISNDTFSENSIAVAESLLANASNCVLPPNVSAQSSCSSPSVSSPVNTRKLSDGLSSSPQHILLPLVLKLSRKRSSKKMSSRPHKQSRTDLPPSVEHSIAFVQQIFFPVNVVTSDHLAKQIIGSFGNK